MLLIILMSPSAYVPKYSRRTTLEPIRRLCHGQLHNDPLSGCQALAQLGLYHLLQLKCFQDQLKLQEDMGTGSSEIIEDSAMFPPGFLLHGCGQCLCLVPEKQLNAQRKSRGVKNAKKFQLPEASPLVRAAPQCLTSTWRM